MNWRKKKNLYGKKSEFSVCHTLCVCDFLYADDCNLVAPHFQSNMQHLIDSFSCSTLGLTINLKRLL